MAESADTKRKPIFVVYKATTKNDAVDLDVKLVTRSEGKVLDMLNKDRSLQFFSRLLDE